MLKTKIAMACLSVFFLQSAMAQTLAEKKIYKDEEKLIQREVEALNKRCEADIKVSFNWPTFKMESLKERGASAFLSQALIGVGTLCESDPDVKQAIQENVKSIVGSQTETRTIELKDNTLNFGISYNSANDTDAVKDYLMNNL